ncbi:MATE family efflux transporter [Meridianimarinicoccus sp. RP-17]|uniref:MATE family efflux transporter n=1 Tax=Meridianimarinicoccus zhengii TaxID=2056810 RepID=UPI001F16BB14|nr:MATE family efflux transporter [Phycocomes zhengii]
MPQMSYPAHVRATLVLGLPLIGGQLGQFLIHVTDVVMVGWYGVPDLAALVVANSIIMVLILFGSGFAWAVMPLAAAAAEAGDDLVVRRVTRMGLWASLGFAVLTVPPLVFTPDLYGLMGQPPRVALLAGQYFAIAAWGVFPALIIMVLRSYLSALERTQVVLWVTLASAVANAGFNWVLIFGNLGAPELGVRGAAIASILTNLVAMAGLAVYARWREPQHEIFVRLWRPDWSALRRVLRMGFPIGVTTLAEVGLFSAASIMMGWVGTEALAAHGIALQLATAVFMVHLGLSQAATVRAGRAYGRGDVGHLRRAALVAAALSLVVALVTVAVFLAVPRPLIGLFLDPAEPQLPAIMAIGVTLLAAAALFQVADSVQVMALGVLRGVQDTRVPMIYAAISYWLLGAPVAYLLGFTAGWGGVGIWVGLAFGLACAAVLMLRRFWWYIVPGLERAEGSPARPAFVM